MMSMLKFQQFKSAFNVVKSKTFIQCFEHAECLAIDINLTCWAMSD